MEFLNVDTGEPREIEVSEDEARDMLRNEAGLEVSEGTNPVESVQAIIRWLRDR